MNEDNVITQTEDQLEIPGVAPQQEEASNVKRIAVVGLCAVAVVAAIVFAGVKRFSSSADIPEKAAASADVASAQTPRLNMPVVAAASGPTSVAMQASGPGNGPSGQAVPSIVPMSNEAIPVQGTGGYATTSGGNGQPSNGAPPVKVMSPDDAPIFSSGAVPDMHAPATVPSRSGSGYASGNGTGSSRVAEANASLDAYKQQLAGMMENLQNLTAGKAGAAPVPTYVPPAVPERTGNPAIPSLFGSMDRSATPRVQAGMLGDRNMIVPKGTLFLCSLKTRVISATSGFIGCQVTRNVLSDNGKVLLIERGSHMDGEYRIVSIKPGVTRIPVLWTRVRTPQGVTIDLESPATGALGESGLGGYVDNRWGERLGAAVMLSLVNDALKYAVQSQTTSGNGNTVLLPNTTDQGSKLAEKVLETTINIPPLLYQNQGGVVGVYVSRDLDFSTVYELRPAQLTPTASE